MSAMHKKCGEEYMSRIKGSQIMEFVQFLKYNMRNIFPKNHIQNVVDKQFEVFGTKYRNPISFFDIIFWVFFNSYCQGLIS